MKEAWGDFEKADPEVNCEERKGHGSTVLIKGTGKWISALFIWLLRTILVGLSSFTNEGFNPRRVSKLLFPKCVFVDSLDFFLKYTNRLSAGK